MFKYLTSITLALFLLSGSIAAGPTYEDSLIARGGGRGGFGHPGEFGRPGEFGARPIQRTPALSRAALDNRYGYGNYGAAAAGYAAGSANNTGYVYPTTAYYPTTSTVSTTPGSTTITYPNP